MSEGVFSLPHQEMMVRGLRVQGGIVGSRQVHRDMLDFAALQKVKLMVAWFLMAEKRRGSRIVSGWGKMWHRRSGSAPY
ncbi:hypothetical protein BJX63DRAFT_264811 [Aspergillus granulosus]|uniref:Uncharacterized protein n=1 Tax=Aspergillus granulosus TaxID=176169 RepID=A0ABR4H9R7_9EURO